MASLQSFVKNLFTSNRQKMAAFHALQAEFDGLNSNLQAVADEKRRLEKIRDDLRTRVGENFKLDDVKLLSTATREAAGFEETHNWIFSFFANTIQSRQQTQRVRDIVCEALKAARDILASKIQELKLSDKKHFLELGLDPESCGTSEPIRHLEGIYVQIRNALHEAEAGSPGTM